MTLVLKECSHALNDCPIVQHRLVQESGVPNFWGERIPISSELNVDKWVGTWVISGTNNCYSW